ncbi:nucleoprotein [New Minto virus]|uniref:Nucleoprotein n=1 Tax=New Minto virus TaxID=1272952 RepID=A0A0D3R1I1_9RHAB|nr:nucleoprotein [New Minto virus]AJR28476.1 nucleoprotein [New Minto virus]
MTTKRLIVKLPGYEKQIVNAGLPDLKVDAVYPSEWFKANDGKKPNVKVFRKPVDVLYRAVYPQIKAEKWDDTLVTSFMVALMDERKDLFTVEHSEGWSSFGRQLVNEGKVSVVDLLTVEDTESEFKDPENIPGGPAEQLSLFCALLTIYRRIQARENQAVKVTDLNSKFKSILCREPYNMRDDDSMLIIPIATKANLTSGFLRVICAIDMFFVKFPQAVGSAIRITSFTTRYRGCTAITALTHTCITLGMYAEDVASLIVPQAPAEDAMRIYQDGQEHDDPYGYFPYHFVMGLSNHSPYSLASAPSLTFYCRCLSAFGGSKNAAYTYTAAGIRSLPELIETAYIIVKKVKMIEPGDLRFATEDAMKNWEANKDARDKLLMDDEEDKVHLHDGVEETGTIASLRSLPTRKALTRLHRKIDDALIELSAYKGLSYQSAMGLFLMAQTYKSADVGTVGHTIYDLYGRNPPQRTE